MRKALGYCLITVSCVAWLLLPVIPFLSISAAAKVSWAGGLFLFAEVTWWLAVPLLGKEMFAWGKQLWQWAQSVLADQSTSAGGSDIAGATKDDTQIESKNTEKHD